MTELQVLAVVQPQTENDATCSTLTTFGDSMETIDSVPGKLLMPQATSRPGSGHIRLGSQKPQTDDGYPSVLPAPVPDWSTIQISKHVDLGSFNPCI